MKRLKQAFFKSLALLLLLLIAGCATPIGVTSLGRDAAYTQIDRTALSSRELSSYTAVVLHRYNLDNLYANSPLLGLQELHRLATGDNRRDALFALAEISFLQGKEGRRKKTSRGVLRSENFYAASAVYSYLFLLGPGEDSPPTSFDRRFRIACDFYNRSLGYIIASRESEKHVTERNWLLPVGSILVTRNPNASDFNLPLKENETYVSADRFKIHGLTVRNRNAGLGSPIVILGENKQGTGFASAGSAATVFLRITGGLADISEGKLRGSVELYSAFARSYVEVNGAKIPLETDLTTNIAYALNNPENWKLSKLLFRLGEAPIKPGIYPAQPYQPGKIPVLFVHGTMSSPVRWAEMWNTLMGDPILRERCQFWFYLYDSAKPVVQSAAHLRDCIESTVSEFDPERKDGALQQMVVIGHSQGGLLTKLTACRTDDILIKTVTGKTMSELKITPDEEKLIRRLAIFEPLPEVKRVIFISTPHRGSYQAGTLARKLARRFIKLPKQALQTAAELVTLAPTISPDIKLAATSIDTMSPNNPAMLALAAIPVAPGIKAHSIIPIKGDDTPPEGEDGVVKYSSAHIDGVESELVVRSGHSCQGTPMAIEEVRRILLVHLRDIKSQSNPSPESTPSL